MATTPTFPALWGWPTQLGVELPTEGEGAAQSWFPNNINLKGHFILLMEEILHQLKYGKYPIIYKVLYIPGGCLDFFHQP